MKVVERFVPFVLVMLMAILPLFSIDIGAAAEPQALPARSTLYGHSETYNWTFAKPAFYGDYDANYPANDLENNTWDDIAFVLYFQDLHTQQVYGNDGAYTSKLTSADIYQAVFVNLSGSKVTTGSNQAILVEDFTATWCTYCTAIVGALERLDHSDWWPNKYLGVEFHGSGTYGNAVGTSRKNYYSSSTGIPTWVVDGVDPNVGGSSSPNVTTIDNNIKAKINRRVAASPLNVTARAGHSSTQAWIDFTVTIDDPTFDNALVECNAVMVQDAFPRRHGANNNAYLGWIAQSMNTQRVFNVPGSLPEISDVSISADDVLVGDVEIKFNVTDADASATKIVKSVSVRKTGAVDWTGIAATETGKYIWKTAEKDGPNNRYPDGNYEVRIWAKDYWWQENEVIVPVSIRNPDPPVIALNEPLMEDQMTEGVLEGVFDILWSASDDEDGSAVNIDLYYAKSGAEWTKIAGPLANTGSYEWDTMDPRVPDDENYRIRAVVSDTDLMQLEVVSAFEFELNNPDPPMLVIQAPLADQELYGQPTIRWAASDDEDAPTSLLVDIYISEDGGTSYTTLVTGKSNSGVHKFDSLLYEDGTDYRVKIIARDTDGLTMEAVSELFSIYNNDAPEATFLSPSESERVSGTVEVSWDANDEEDSDEDLVVDLYYMFSEGTYWKELAVNEPNTGSFMMDTLSLAEGDGIYTLRVDIEDSRGELSEQAVRMIEVYNPDAPVITAPTIPSGPVEKTASVSWMVYDPDPGETDLLKVWIYVISQDGIPTMVADGVANTGQYSFGVPRSIFPDGTYSVKILIADCQETNMTTEQVLTGLIIDNNDPPVVEFTTVPVTGTNNTGPISLSWEGSDPEDKGIMFRLYYQIAGTDTWVPISGAGALTSTTFVWDISLLETGDYVLRIVAIDGSKEKLEAEDISNVFSIYIAPVDDDDDVDDDVTPIEDDGGNDTTVLIVVLLVIALFLVLLIVLGALIVMKRKNAQQQMPPPGGLPPMMYPPLPGAQAPGLPQAQAQPGGLPPQNRPAPQLPPAQQQPAPPQANPTAPAVPPQAPPA